jgi:hypothetical protein
MRAYSILLRSESTSKGKIIGIRQKARILKWCCNEMDPDSAVKHCEEDKFVDLIHKEHDDFHASNDNYYGKSWTYKDSKNDIKKQKNNC